MTQSIEDTIRSVDREVLTEELTSMRARLQELKPPVGAGAREFLLSAEVAELARCRPVSVRRALEASDLHGTQHQRVVEIARKGGQRTARAHTRHSDTRCSALGREIFSNRIEEDENWCGLGLIEFVIAEGVNYHWLLDGVVADG